MQRAFTADRYFQMQSYEAVKQAYQVHFPDAAAVPNKSTIFRLVNRFRETGSTNDKRRTVSTNTFKWVEFCVQHAGRHIR
jgi:hypothetical protein